MTSNPKGARSEISVLRRIGRAFSATRAGSGKGLRPYVPHGGTKAQNLNVVDVRIAGNQLHVGVVQEGGEETLHAVEPLARTRGILHLAHDLRLPVLGARFALAQLLE